MSNDKVYILNLTKPSRPIQMLVKNKESGKGKRPFKLHLHD